MNFDKRARWPTPSDTTKVSGFPPVSTTSPRSPTTPLIPNAVEEFLRAYAAVSLYRSVTAPATIGGVEMSPGDTVMMAFPAACRDPEMFENPNEVDIERQKNRHVAFGAGIHRCLGSNLARLELNVAIETWLELIPDFELLPDAEVTWSGGGIRGPRQVPVRIPETTNTP